MTGVLLCCQSSVATVLPVKQGLAYTNQEIAGALHKSTGTVRNQVSFILAKLNVRDRTRAVLKAIDNGLL